MNVGETDSSDLIRVVAVRGAATEPAWSFSLPRGGALWIPEGGDSVNLWLDWLTGIEAPPEGEVFWKGVEWRRRGPDEAAAERGRMGCVFDSDGVVMNLDMDENVWLPARMHRRAKEAAASIERWATFFGCWPLAQERWPVVKERDRRRLLWTRAFSGEPELLVLERPLREVPVEDRVLFLKAVRQVRAEGRAVVWLEKTLDADARAALEPVFGAVADAK